MVAPESRRPDRGDRWLRAALVVLATLPYANALGTGFVFDDAGLVVGHPQVRGAFDPAAILTAPYWGSERALDTALWRPITTLTFALDHAIAGSSAAWMHGTNVVLHACVVLLVLAVARRLGASRRVAGATAALFAVHPLHTEAVTWVSGRAELLAALGVLGSLWIASERDRAAPRSALLCAAGTLVALGSKESAAFLPFAIAGLVASQGATRRRALTLGAASLGAVLVYVALRGAVLGTWSGPVPSPGENPMVGTTLFERLPTVLSAAGRYVALVAWPRPLSIDYGPPVLELESGLSLLGAAGLVAAIGLVALSLLRGRTLEGRAAGFTLLSYGVASNLVVVIGTHFAERLFYLPSFGVLLLAVAALVRVPLPRTLAAVLTACLALAAAGTWERNRAYRDDLTLAEATLAHFPDAPKMVYNRARELGRRGQHAEAAEAARHSIRLRPDDDWAPIVLANALVGLGEPEAAEAALREAIERIPRSPRPRARLLELLDARGAHEEADALAEQTFERGAREAPWPERAAWAAQRRGELPLATERWTGATRRRPENAASWTELGRTLYATGRLTEARRAFERALALEPQRRGPANGLAWLLLDQGVEPERALALAEIANTGPDDPAYLDTKARALESVGRCEEALRVAARAAGLDASLSERLDRLRRECASAAGR